MKKRKLASPTVFLPDQTGGLDIENNGFIPVLVHPRSPEKLSSKEPISQQCVCMIFSEGIDCIFIGRPPSTKSSPLTAAKLERDALSPFSEVLLLFDSSKTSFDVANKLKTYPTELNHSVSAKLKREEAMSSFTELFQLFDDKESSRSESNHSTDASKNKIVPMCDNVKETSIDADGQEANPPLWMHVSTTCPMINGYFVYSDDEY
jgi:hypothetical protein